MVGTASSVCIFLFLGNLLVEGQMIYSSCKQALERACNPVDGRYFIKAKTDLGYIEVKCKLQDFNMSTECPGGGWTPVLKVNGNSSNFFYTSNYWTNRETLNPSEWVTFDIGSTETKLPTYWSTPFDEICIKRLDGSKVVIPFSGRTLERVMRSDQKNITNAGADAWKGLAPGFNSTLLGNNCGVEGFNVGTKHSIRARVGFISVEDHAGCSSKIEGIGLGLEASMSLKLSAGYLYDVTLSKKVFLVYVRERRDSGSG